MTKDKYIPCLLNLFRQHGYDGATLSKISKATGLGKASLYHHFPGGKDEMVTTILNYLEQALEENIKKPLRGEGDACDRFKRMCQSVNNLYEGGQQPCLFAILLLGSARDIFQEKVGQLLESWISEIAKVLIEAGKEENIARQRGEDAVIAIQGALILAQGLEDVAPFERILQELPEQLCI
ncbi:TetR/AcrR family transcriptional regulator [Aphanothece hegewaldii CCALA 016]|uniref:TetR/AcrR family transcriptional regulator n=1 Tax=Aphanothece hegewaldii CCALA 016 TaxID=2107694 RepID=A0A2T1LXM8_9CHRO|nr:TetR/AcrR family transcriptional regulator [Aphanothece hegewaldii]PSF37129.1 TetR/AcrR family transcriptional regulator [Aphanothece hegewaldii CCALA 016]